MGQGKQELVIPVPGIFSSRETDWGLESVSHYPILAVTTGILIQLVIKTDKNSQPRILKCLLSDPGFQMSSLEFLLGKHQDVKVVEDTKASKDFLADKKNKPFSFLNYEEVNDEEKENIKTLVAYLDEQKKEFTQQTEEIKEEDLCTICYANQISAIFAPCGHQSCKSCIRQQMMSKKECFFCKVVVTSVKDFQGQVILTNPGAGNKLPHGHKH
ncbi:hypothetical protein FSP39_021675 [Pinctada imbricata]|uniref:RING-type E3 ubiquitin transferase n=1 Tax=Pinctada imbricata TaxID=66713 RepID=A0AA89C8F6_PINIB|nr:hypothetical protein FSP39_021675 [Pinctada imbricata]